MRREGVVVSDVMGGGDIVYFLIVYKLNRLNYMDFFV